MNNLLNLEMPQNILDKTNKFLHFENAIMNSMQVIQYACLPTLLEHDVQFPHDKLSKNIFEVS